MKILLTILGWLLSFLLSLVGLVLILAEGYVFGIATLLSAVAVNPVFIKRSPFAKNYGRKVLASILFIALAFTSAIGATHGMAYLKSLDDDKQILEYALKIAEKDSSEEGKRAIEKIRSSSDPFNLPETQYYIWSAMFWAEAEQNERNREGNIYKPEEDILDIYDFERANVGLLKSAQSGYAPAQTLLCGLVGEATFKQDDAQQLSWCEKAAAQEYAPAMVKLAEKYSSFDGVELPKRNISVAIEWYEKAAALGDTDAMWGLHGIYLRDGENKNTAKATQWLAAGAEAGDARAQSWLARDLLREKKYTEAVSWYERARKDEIAQREAGFFLAVCYRHGLGLVRDLEKSETMISEYIKASRDDSPYDMVSRAVELLEGDGLPKDDELAIRLLREAAAEEYYLAELQLGFMYRYGIGGLARDPDQALKYYELAQSHGAEAKEDIQELKNGLR